MICLFEVKCKSGNRYGLALGPTVLSRLQKAYAKVLPTGAILRAQQIADSKGINLADIEESDLLDAMTPEEVEMMMGNTFEANVIAVMTTLREVNGESIADVEKFLDEMESLADFNELAEIVRGRIEEFKLGTEAKGESKLSSSEQEMEKART